MSRGENGKTRVTFVWEPLPKAPGDRPREEPARVSLMAIAPDGSPAFRGKVPDVALASTAPAASASAAGAGAAQTRGPSRVSFDVNPGKIQLRISAEGAGSQVLDSETREITVPDLTSRDATLGTPSVLRARTAREFQQLKADAEAVPIAGAGIQPRSNICWFASRRTGPAGPAPALRVHLLNRTGAAMNELKAEPSPRTGEQQIDLPLAALPPANTSWRSKPAISDGNATELVGFRVTG